MRKFTISVAVVLAVAVVWVAGVRLERFSEDRESANELLYLPNGNYLKVASLGQSSVIADAIYLWSIQFYSNYGRADRFRYVEHVFGDVISVLDPHYIDPYWMGALILSVEARDVDAALRLLDKGFELNPEAWTLPWLAGWELYYVERYEEASRYFDLAAAVPDAPAMVLRMRAGMLSRAGDLRLALRLWKEVLDDPRSDAASIAVAERQIRGLEVRVVLSDLKGAVGKFRIHNGRWPKSLEELAVRGYIRSVPPGPDGGEYGYDPSTGEVFSSAGRVLGDY